MDLPVKDKESLVAEKVVLTVWRGAIIFIFVAAG